MRLHSSLKKIVLVIAISVASQVQAASLTQQVNHWVGHALDFHSGGTAAISTSWWHDLWAWWKNYLESIKNNGGQNGGSKDPVSVSEPDTWVLFLVGTLGFIGYRLIRRPSH